MKNKIKRVLVLLSIAIIFFVCGQITAKIVEIVCQTHKNQQKTSENVVETNKNEQILVENDEKQPKIEEIVEEVIPVCNLDEISCLIKDIALQYGIDWKIPVSIAKWETGHYTSFAFKEYNNVGGMMYWDNSKHRMRLIQYSSLEIGIDKFISNLKKGYIDKGLTTISQIQKKYAPIGNNDDGTNSQWTRGVSSIYSSLED